MTIEKMSADTGRIDTELVDMEKAGPERVDRDLVIIGGGAAGMAAASACHEAGLEDILLLERGDRLGGILNQCIHDGFGLHKFRESLTGPEYALRYIKRIRSLGIEVKLNSMVIDLSPDKVLKVVTREGLLSIRARAVILAMGSRERTRGAIGIPGTRPSGVLTAGVAQNLINMKNHMVGRRAVILGSGDIGLIMARRLTLEGAKVLMVLEKLPYPGGLSRNINQCLRDFEIPLHLNHTVTGIRGRERLTGIHVAEVDEGGKPLKSTEYAVECDTLLLSVGLIPENELSRKAGVRLNPVTGGAVVDDYGQTGVAGIFSCGNVLQIHDLVDNVSHEGETLAEGVLRYLEKGTLPQPRIPVIPGEGVKYCLPQHISGRETTVISLRPTLPGGTHTLRFVQAGRVIKKKKLLKVNPAEMERVEINSGQLVNNDELRVELLLEGSSE